MNEVEEDDIISIVVPIYNEERHLKKLIKSILRQTYTKWRLILVDDGSTDNSRKIIDCFVQKDSRIYAIYQKRKGSVEARKNGVLSKIVRGTSYIIMSDADDLMPPDAIEKLYYTAKFYQADVVCGEMRRIWGRICLPQFTKSRCFEIQEPRLYSHREIIQELFISYFGITDFPVNLWAKLYRTDILVKAIDFPPVVHFLGDDLSVTIRVISQISTLILIPDVVYFYRIGGGTSEFQPYMMEDFINLYRYKKTFANLYTMPQNPNFYMNIELLNMTKTYFAQYFNYKEHSLSKLKKEIKRVSKITEIHDAGKNIMNANLEIAYYAKLIYEVQIEEIVSEIYKFVKKTKWKTYFKNLLKKIVFND